MIDEEEEVLERVECVQFIGLKTDFEQNFKENVFNGLLADDALFGSVARAVHDGSEEIEENIAFRLIKCVENENFPQRFDDVQTHFGQAFLVQVLQELNAFVHLLAVKCVYFSAVLRSALVHTLFYAITRRVARLDHHHCTRAVLLLLLLQLIVRGRGGLLLLLLLLLMVLL